MITVVDQVNPWLIPSSPFATSTQVHVGAHISMKGTGAATTPPGDENLPASDAVGESSGGIVRDRLRHAKHDDERQDGRPSGELKLLFGEERQNAALHADHRADERVDDDEQRELRDVLAKPETNDGWHMTDCRHRHALVFTS